MNGHPSFAVMTQPRNMMMHELRGKLPPHRQSVGTAESLCFPCHFEMHYDTITPSKLTLAPWGMSTQFGNFGFSLIMIHYLRAGYMVSQIRNKVCRGSEDNTQSMVFWQSEDRRLNVFRNKVLLGPFPVLLPHPLCSWEASHRNQTSSLKWVIETRVPHLSPASGPGQRNATSTKKSQRNLNRAFRPFCASTLKHLLWNFLEHRYANRQCPLGLFFISEASCWPILAKLICYAFVSLTCHPWLLWVIKHIFLSLHLLLQRKKRKQKSFRKHNFYLSVHQPQYFFSEKYLETGL